MCMGFGCNAAGVVACRIIDAPRERLIAILTNTFVPCHGRFPTLILLALVFISAAVSPPWRPWPRQGRSWRPCWWASWRHLLSPPSSLAPC
jgi:hypothetical protein